ncbi:DUF6498-containing protein [Natronolimnohabitans sp. A-GB9]|uniref:DUF6498-containing protein n=1 Tax=Natronolimnohabitans sp. A-GB9 TaxID=3069757 RepID=UPI0027B025F7|nr:DUF6498-containing protein [Natronolimnohabitans sp. A-GB9]MDQ2052577.1 DUF6498-containing protein [Natronolimnohabitans sp. A-GB9]
MKFYLIALINVLPIGLLYFGFSAEEVLFAFWLEMVGFVVIYSLLCLFVPPEREDEEQESTPLTISVPFVSSRVGSAQPFDRIPPIYFESVKYTTGGIFLGGAFWAVSGTILIDYSTPTIACHTIALDRSISRVHL